MSLSERERASIALRVALYAFAVLVVSLFLGSQILRFFGISMPALRIAGGLVVAVAGWSMLHATPVASERHARLDRRFRSNPEDGFFSANDTVDDGSGHDRNRNRDWHQSTGRFRCFVLLSHRLALRGIGRDCGDLSCVPKIERDGPASRRRGHERDNEIVGVSAALHWSADHCHRAGRSGAICARRCSPLMLLQPAMTRTMIDPQIVSRIFATG